MVLHAFPDGFEYILAHIIQDFMRFLHQTGLSGPQIHVLLHIYHAGECPITEIANLSGASPAAASQLIDRLAQQGLVERREDSQDRRVRKLRLTDKSRKLIQQGIVSNSFLQDLMSGLTEKQRKTVHLAFGYLAKASMQVNSSREGQVEHHA